MSAAINRAGTVLEGDGEVVGRVATGVTATVGAAGARGLAALERRARDLLAGNLTSTPDGRRAAAAYLWEIEAWAVGHGDPYVVASAPRGAIYVEARVARVRGFDSVTRDVAYRNLEGDVLRGDLFAEVGQRLPATASLPATAQVLAQAPASAVSAACRDGDPTATTYAVP